MALSLSPSRVSYELCVLFKERTTSCFSFRDHLLDRAFDSSMLHDMHRKYLHMLSARDESCLRMNSLPAVYHSCYSVLMSCNT